MSLDEESAAEEMDLSTVNGEMDNLSISERVKRRADNQTYQRSKNIKSPMIQTPSGRRKA